MSKQKIAKKSLIAFVAASTIVAAAGLAVCSYAAILFIPAAIAAISFASKKIASALKNKKLNLA